jgi:hypothetical protein
MFNLLNPEFNQKLTHFRTTAYSFGKLPKKTKIPIDIE